MSTYFSNSALPYYSNKLSTLILLFYSITSTSLYMKNILEKVLFGTFNNVIEPDWYVSLSVRLFTLVPGTG